MMVIFSISIILTTECSIHVFNEIKFPSTVAWRVFHISLLLFLIDYTQGGNLLVFSYTSLEVQWTVTCALVLHNCHISKLKHDEALPHAGGELIPDTFTVNEPDNYYQEVCSVLKMYLTYILKVHLKVDFCSFGNTPTAAATRCTMCL